MLLKICSLQVTFFFPLAVSVGLPCPTISYLKIESSNTNSYFCSSLGPSFGAFFSIYIHSLGDPIQSHGFKYSLYVFCLPYLFILGFPGGASDKEFTCQCRRCKRCRFDPWVRKISWRKAWQSPPVFLPWESHGLQSIWSQRVRHDKNNLTCRCACYPDCHIYLIQLRTP